MFYNQSDEYKIDAHVDVMQGYILFLFLISYLSLFCFLQRKKNKDEKKLIQLRLEETPF
jgi:hypothetical protein